jgi:hypothetical protein
MTDTSSSSRLFKLKFFCQICNKQLQDKDGFKCHLNSNYHKQNLEIVADNPKFYISSYSKEFETGYMDILKRNYSVNWVSANKIYQEYISDKYATHMNATKWNSLTGFINYLESIGKILVKEDDKEIKIKYIDNTPKGIYEKNIIEKKKKVEMLLEKLNQKKIQEKIKKDEELYQLKKAIKNENDNNNNKIENKINESELKKPIEFELNLNLYKLKNQQKNGNSIFLNDKETKKNNFNINFNIDENKNNKDNKENKEKIKNSYSLSDKIFNRLGNKLHEDMDNKIPIRDAEAEGEGKLNINKKDFLSKKKIRQNKKEEIKEIKKEQNKNIDKDIYREMDNINDYNDNDNDNYNDNYEEIKLIKSTSKNKYKNYYNENSESENEGNKDIEVKNYFDKELPWLKKGLIIKIKDINLSSGEYYDCKALIIKVIDDYVGELRLLKGDTILRIDQEFLEPYLPKVNTAVRILYGENIGKIGILKEINENMNNCLIDISSDNIDIENYIYADLNGISKVHMAKEI